MEVIVNNRWILVIAFSPMCQVTVFHNYLKTPQLSQFILITYLLFSYVNVVVFMLGCSATKSSLGRANSFLLLLSFSCNVFGCTFFFFLVFFFVCASDIFDPVD